MKHKTFVNGNSEPLKSDTHLVIFSKLIYPVLFLSLLLLGCGGGGGESTETIKISGIDLNSFLFDVDFYDVGTRLDGLNNDATASGTSNGIGWSISPTSLWSGRTTTDETFSFGFLPKTTDNLHASKNFTITFDRSVDTLLVALSNDDSTDTINFGIAPVKVSGVSASGSQIILDNISGGLALFENVNSLTIRHTDDNGVSDGFDLAFHVVSPSTP